MITKNITLKAHCNSCLQVLFQKPVTLKLAKLEHLKEANGILKALFPKTISCDECDTHGIDYSYTYSHKHVFETDEEKAKVIDRCKAQIAATYDTNSNIPAKERALLREDFQQQLAFLLEQNKLTIQ